MGLQMNYKLLLDDVSATALEASRTAEIDVATGESITLIYTFTRVGATSSAISLTVYKSVDGGTKYGDIQSLAVAGGAGTASDYTVTKTTSTSDAMSIDFDTRSCNKIKVIASVTSGDADDLITLQVGIAERS